MDIARDIEKMTRYDIRTSFFKRRFAPFIAQDQKRRARNSDQNYEHASLIRQLNSICSTDSSAAWVCSKPDLLGGPPGPSAGFGNGERCPEGQGGMMKFAEWDREYQGLAIAGALPYHVFTVAERKAAHADGLDPGEVVQALAEEVENLEDAGIPHAECAQAHGDIERVMNGESVETVCGKRA